MDIVRPHGCDAGLVYLLLKKLGKGSPGPDLNHVSALERPLICRGCHSIQGEIMGALLVPGIVILAFLALSVVYLRSYR